MSFFAFPPVRLQLAQLIHRTVQVALQFRLVPTRARQRVPQDSLDFKVIAALIIAVFRNFERGDDLTLDDSGTTPSLRLALIFASNGPNDKSLAVPRQVVES